jgi:hypothetical protein
VWLCDELSCQHVFTSQDCTLRTYPLRNDNVTAARTPGSAGELKTAVWWRNRATTTLNSSTQRSCREAAGLDFSLLREKITMAQKKTVTPFVPATAMTEFLLFLQRPPTRPSSVELKYADPKMTGCKHAEVGSRSMFAVVCQVPLPENKPDTW